MSGQVLHLASDNGFFPFSKEHALIQKINLSS